MCSTMVQRSVAVDIASRQHSASVVVVVIERQPAALRTLSADSPLEQIFHGATGMVCHIEHVGHWVQAVGTGGRVSPTTDA